MHDAMAQQKEIFSKMLEDRDANNRKHETVAENNVGGSGGLDHVIQTETPVNPEAGPKGRTCSYKTFQCNKPPEFSGSDNPFDYMNWIREIKQAFRSSKCREESKVTYAFHMPKGNALQRWNVATSNQNETVITRMSWFQRETVGRVLQ